MKCWALIISTNLCNEMFHQSGTCKYRTCFYYSRSWKRPQRGVQFTHKYSDTEWRLSAYERLQQKTEQVRKAEKRREGRQVRRGERGPYSLMWLLWPGFLQRSRLLHLHFGLKIAAVIIYSGGRAHPVLCSRDRCSLPVTRLTLLASLASFHSSWMCEILCFWFTSLSVSLPQKAAVSSSCQGVPV